MANHVLHYPEAGDTVTDGNVSFVINFFDPQADANVPHTTTPKTHQVTAPLSQDDTFTIYGNPTTDGSRSLWLG